MEEITVTAQKVEQRIQDVPIAVSAFSEDRMDDLKIERGEELLRAIPNVTFSKSNFSSYNFSIRGVGTKAISASSDPAVAVSFNHAPLLRNRLFEQEFFDVERVEVLRGPQGTLFGRNATGGVVDMLPRMPEAEFGA
ncbi:MAG: TonB-dependent receptor plug domain-containing protein, partial [Gammaproteobacteria bacterium]|nr:TonB-dependent receptor plug domain-containing protein [Gammaproteobacteria bacterium]